MYAGLTRYDRLLPVIMRIACQCMMNFVALLFLFPGIATGADTPGSDVPNHLLPQQLSLRLALLNTLAKHIPDDYQINAGDHCGLNPANNLTACFTRQGLELATRTGQVSLALSAWGRSGSLKKVQPVTPTITGGRVEYARDGMVEWYLNIPQGIEQGFTIDQAPPGDGDLVIQLSSNTAFASHANKLSWGKLDYSGLFAIDARGRELDAGFRSQGRQVYIEINDHAAVYPITIDPLIQEQKLTTSGTADDWFGFSVALSGDGNTALIGARKADIGANAEQGAAYVFVRNAGIWTEEEILTGSDSAEGDHFGSSVTLSFDGDVAVVGAFWADISFIVKQGAAYIFKRTGGSWSQDQKLTTPPPAFANDEFGTVAISGDGTTVLVGARKADVGGVNNQGAAYVFIESGGTWIVQDTLLAVGAAASDSFGASTALAANGNAALVGASHEGAIPATSGAAYVFARGAGVWAQQDSLTASDGTAGDRFGSASALSDDGDTGLVGAWGSNLFQGAAYVYTRNGVSWTEEQKLTASDGVANDFFGNATALSGDGDTAIIAAPSAGIAGNPNQGAVYRYGRVAGNWSEREKLIAFDGMEDEQFGLEGAIALSDDGATALVGVKKASVGGNSEQGAAYVFINTPIAVTDLILPSTDLAVPFGNVTELTTSEQELTVTNDGIADLTLGNIAMLNPLLAPFSILNDLCSGMILNPAGSCAFTVEFSPGSVASFSDDFNVLSVDPTILPVTVSVSGSGTSPIPDITVLNAVDFGSVAEMGVADEVITITNGGDGNLTIGNIGLADSLLAPFNIPVANDNCSAMMLTPSGMCQFTVQFSPTMTGSFTDNFDIPSDDPDENPVVVSVTGTGLPTPDITVTDSVNPNVDLDLPFGDVTELSFDDQIVTITNDGNATLVIEQIGQAETLAAPFSIVVDGCSGQPLTPAANCTLTVRFAPVDTSASSDSFDIPSNDPDETSLLFTVSGMGTATPANIVITDSVLPGDDMDIPFGNTTELTSSDQTVTITNSGNTDLSIGQIAQADPLATPFIIQTDSCSGNVVTPVGNCSFIVRFSPAAAGVFNNSFDIPSDDPDSNSVTVTVSGTGTATLVPEITVTDSAPPIDDLRLPFGNVTENNTSTQTVTVSNDGTATLMIDQIQLTDNQFATFSIGSDTCSGTLLPPTSSCLVALQFLPASSGPFNATLDIPSDDLDESIVTISLDGTGTAMLVADITVTDSVAPAADLSIDFGTVTQSTSADQNITIVNNGNADLILGLIGMADSLMPPFRIPTEGDDCSGQTLAAAASCVLTIEFEPVTEGVFTETLDIPSNDPDEPSVTITVRGTGTSAPVPDIAVTDAVAPTTDLQLPFGNVTENSLENQTITIGNSGDTNLVIGQIAQQNPLNGPFSIQNDDCSEQILIPSGDCTVTVQFLPTSAGSFSDSFNIPSNDPDEEEISFDVSGSGIAAGNGSNNDGGGGGGSFNTAMILFLLMLITVRHRTDRRQWVREQAD